MTVRERPILFSAPMVRAILEGRKTQTRRVVKLTDSGHVKEPRGHRRWHPADPDVVLGCPYGQPGDRLWVRETWRPAAEFLSECVGPKDIRYAATVSEAERATSKWRSPIFMPRWASRITLELTEVRIERLNAISLEDAAAEGWPGRESADPNPYTWFSALWVSINGPGSWISNPWVWVLKFRRLEEQASR